jgi:aspartate kinase
MADALEAVTPVVEELGGRIGATDQGVSKVSVVGLGMAEQTGVANRMFRGLADAGVNLQIITTSEIKISALVKRDVALDALRVVHNEFELDRLESKELSLEQVAADREPADLDDVVSRLQGIGMEGLLIDDISLDDTQSRITLSRIPNQPGVAAGLFERISDAGVFVDMIVQSYASDQVADVTFTVPRTDLSKALEIANAVCEEHGCDGVEHKEAIAKLSVSGIGLRSHTGVAIGMFEALADSQINVEMISTSEVRVNVVVDSSDGSAGLKCLESQFAK